MSSTLGQDAFLDTAFFIQNTFNYLMLGIKTGIEKILSTISYPFRVLLRVWLRLYRLFLKVIRKAVVSLVSKETKRLTEQYR